MPSDTETEARRLVDAVQIGAEFNLSPGRVNALHADREKTGFPAARRKNGRKQEWDYSEVAMYFADRDALNRLANLPAGAGDPDELLNASQVAKELGYKNPNQITTYMRDHPGYFAEPDVVEHLGSEERPWTRMQWYRRTITAWRKERPGRGRREGNTRTPPALPKVSPDGDPDELLAAPQAAALLGFKSVNTFSSSLAQGNLPLLKESDGQVPGSRGRKSRAWTRRRVLDQKAARSPR
ncbi:hypothetical protein [Streptomyces hygroscopicus]|uniref:hypothetical protein n=1 Tax=Streptomyces hygroscopicus TaxID=1912 RepID=UPI0007847D83|nr:hypothetical protein [Streptomyces hygroscopicus]